MSRIAWFRTTLPDAGDPLDDTAPVIARLRQHHHLDVITEAEAHAFVWRDFRDPYDVIVHEPGTTPAHRYMRAYAPHYPGVTAPRGLGVGHWESGVDASKASTPDSQLPTPNAIRVAALGRSLDRSIERARSRGANVEQLAAAPRDAIAAADVVVALEWPPAPGAPTAALLGMAAAKAVVVFEVEATAGWPALNPQTWLPRDETSLPAVAGRKPIVISIDPRDEEHSLMLALVRLAADPLLRESLANAGHAWWHEHATLDHAVAAWEALIREAAARGREAGQGADYSDRLREQLQPFGVDPDVFGLRSPLYGSEPPASADRRPETSHS